MEMTEIMLTEAREKGRMINEAIKIIEKLSKSDIADSDIMTEDYKTESIDEVKDLIIQARGLTSDRWWQQLK